MLRSRFGRVIDWHAIVLRSSHIVTNVFQFTLHLYEMSCNKDHETSHLLLLLVVYRSCKPYDQCGFR